MFRVLVNAPSRYPVTRKRIRQLVTKFLKKKKLSLDTEVSIYFVGDRKMMSLNKKYLDRDGTTDVLAFSLNESKTPFPHQTGFALGDIIISFPQARRQAGQFNLLVDEEIDKLVSHGLNHLVGIHHQ